MSQRDAPPPRTPRIRNRFLATLLAILAAHGLPLAVWSGAVVHRTWQLDARASVLIGIGAFAAWMGLLGTVVRTFFRDVRANPVFVWTVAVPVYVLLSTGMFFLPATVLLLPARIFLADGPWFATWSSALALGLALGVYGTAIRRFVTPLRRIDVRVEGLPAALEGYTFAQLSDVHCGPNMPRWFLDRLARRASAAGAHAIVLTGDYVSHGLSYHPDVTAFVKSLRAPDGVYACLGNHDYFGAPDTMEQTLSAGGAVVLRNRGVTVRARGSDDATFWLGGVDDTWTGRADVGRTLADRPAGVPSVVLAHDPVLFPEIVRQGGADLVLSGHTHAGQLAVPFAVSRFNLARLRYAYSAGAYREGRSTLYVHPGNGTTGPASRLGAAPEIAVLRLVRA